MMKSKDRGFRLTTKPYIESQQAGFQMLFENGYRVSVQFGTSVECENNLANPEHRFKTPVDDFGYLSSRNAEFSVIDTMDEDNYITDRFCKPGDSGYVPYLNYIGNLTPEEVAVLIAKVAKAKRPKKVVKKEETSERKASKSKSTTKKKSSKKTISKKKSKKE